MTEPDLRRRRQTLNGYPDAAGAAGGRVQQRWGRMRVGMSVAALALAASVSAAAQTSDPDARIPDDATMRKRHSLPPSRFATIAGEPVHYVDEGKGPALLMLHGSYASLRQWDDMASRLARRYRVVRYDQSPSGLSGPNPAGVYSLEQRMAVIDGLMDRMKIDRFVIVGTSSAGVPTTAYAATRPRRIIGMIAINIAIARFPFDLSTMPKALQEAVAEDRTHPTFHRPEYWRQVLLANIEDKTRVTSALVRQWTDLNNRAMRDPAIGKGAYAQFTPFSRSAEDLPKISAPTLILWGRDDHETSVEAHGIPAFTASGAVDKTLELVPNCGHMAPLDCPTRLLERIEPFLHRITATKEKTRR